MAQDFEARYQVDDTPWDHGVSDFNLHEVVQLHKITPCRAMDIGCGTGDNSIWLAQQGFDVTGCDLSATAIDKAKEKASNLSVGLTFYTNDFLQEPPEEKPFGLIFDRGCFHCISSDERPQFVQHIYERLMLGGWWISLIGNADEPPREGGPPRMTAAEIAGYVEGSFEVHELKRTVFGGEQENPPWAWGCLFKRRS